MRNIRSCLAKFIFSISTPNAQRHYSSQAAAMETSHLDADLRTGGTLQHTKARTIPKDLVYLV